MTNFIKKFTCFSIIGILFLTACGPLKPKKVDLRQTPADARERARKNIEEGRGVGIGTVMGGKGTTYEFSTSNPLWRASLETLDFIPMATVDYSGGIIITDWYSDTNTNDSLKITVRFLSNTVEAASLKIIVHKKNCKPTENCQVNILTSNIKQELARAILAKAAILDKEKNKTKK